MSIVAVDTITDAAGGNTASINGIPLRQGVIDPENRIINGAFDFWQRGTSGTANTYVAADRWANGVSGGTVTQSRQSHTVGDKFGSNTPQFYLRQTVSGQSASGEFSVSLQRIEGALSYAGEIITVLGWARRSSGAGNVVVEGEQVFGTGGSPSASVFSISPTTITLTSDWEPFAAVMTVPSVAGKTLGTNGNDYLSINFWTSAGSDYNARSNSLGLQTIGVDFWGIHIKLGVHTADATALYKQPELGPELARCQRYYQQHVGVPLRGVVSTGPSASRMSYSFPTTMRTTPTIAFTSAVTIYDGVTGTTINSITANYSSPSACEIDGSVNSTSLVVGRALISYSSGWSIILDAEL